MNRGESRWQSQDPFRTGQRRTAKIVRCSELRNRVFEATQGNYDARSGAISTATGCHRSFARHLGERKRTIPARKVRRSRACGAGAQFHRGNSRNDSAHSKRGVVQTAEESEEAERVSSEEQELLKEIAKKLDILIGFAATVGRGIEDQIDLLTSLGYAPAFIGPLVGLSANAVAIRVHRSKRR